MRLDRPGFGPIAGVAVVEGGGGLDVWALPVSLVP